VYVGMGEAQYALDAATGTKKWSFSTTLSAWCSTVSNGVLYVSSNTGKLFVTDAATGTGKWSFDTGNLNSIRGYPCVVTKQGKVVRGGPGN
jgi:eukaryotic-like serine/threonine-protein kinase